MTVTLHSPPEGDLTKAELDRWRRIPVAVAVDLGPEAVQIDPAIRPLRPAGQQPLLFGRAVTVLCEPPDFGAVLHALDVIRPGDVLMIAADGQRDNAMIGEILSGHLRRKGAAGLVVDGAIRDVATLAGWTDFPVFARWITPRGPTGAAAGAVNRTVMLGGCSVSAGDLVIGDDDGLVVLTPTVVRDRISAAEAKLVTEAQWMSALETGASAAGVFGLPPVRRA